MLSIFIWIFNNFGRSAACPKKNVKCHCCKRPRSFIRNRLEDLESHIICTYANQLKLLCDLEWEGALLGRFCKPRKKPGLFNYSAQYAVRTSIKRSLVFVGSYQRNPHFKEKDRLRVGFLPVRLKSFCTENCNDLLTENFWKMGWKDDGKTAVLMVQLKIHPFATADPENHDLVLVRGWWFFCQEPWWNASYKAIVRTSPPDTSDARCRGSFQPGSLTLETQLANQYQNMFIA